MRRVNPVWLADVLFPMDIADMSLDGLPVGQPLVAVWTLQHCKPISIFP